MKVLNLRCVHDHRFEGWFAHGEAFESQNGQGLVECPVCGSTGITQLPSAPRLNVSTMRETPPVTAAPIDASTQMQTRWMHAVREMMQNTEDVGERFPEEARRIHYGETAHRGIRGKASSEDAQALRDEGIEVVSVPVPKVLEGPLQ